MSKKTVHQKGAKKAWKTMRKRNEFISSLSPVKQEIALFLSKGNSKEAASKKFRSAYVTMVLNAAKKENVYFKALTVKGK